MDPKVLKRSQTRKCTDFCIPRNCVAIYVVAKMIILDLEPEVITYTFPEQAFPYTVLWTFRLKDHSGVAFFMHLLVQYAH